MTSSAGKRAARLPRGVAPVSVREVAGETSRERPWTRLDLALGIALLVALLASLAWLVRPSFDATASDASMYVLCAKALIAGEGYSYLGTPFTIRPPGFSLLIAPVIASRGLDFHALNLVVAAFGVATAVLLYVLMRPRTGAWIAFATALAVFLNPGFQRASNQVMSDVPGVALALGCLLVERWSRRGRPRREVVLALCIGFSAYVRSVEILLVPAILVARAIEQGLRHEDARGWLAFARERVLVLAIVPVLVLLPWNVRNARVAGEAPRAAADQNFIESYSTGMWHADPGDPASPRLAATDVLARVPTRARQTLSLLGSRMETSRGGTLEVALGGALLAAAFVVLLLRRRASDFFLFPLTAVIAVYFGFQDRLALPVFVLALASSAELVAILSNLLPGGRRQVAGVTLANAATALGVFGLAFADFRPRQGWANVDELHRTYGEIARAVEARLAPDARVGSAVGWHLSVYLGRPVHSLLFAIRRSGDVASSEGVIDRYGLNTVVLTPFSEAERSALGYFEKRYAGESAGPARVFRVRP